MNDEVSMRECLSALADGELPGHECPQALAYARTDEGRASWQTYHVIGDVMRGVAAMPMLDASMLEGLRARIAQERPSAVLAPDAEPVVSLQTHAAEAANASVWHWKLAAGFASLTAAVALGWTAYSNLGAPPAAGMQLASNAGVQSPVRLLVNEQGVIRDPQLDELMRQSGRYGGMSVQQREPFLRNVGLQGQSRR
ncbi:MAG: hypothetical protein BGO13_00955 [Burkholderiales bacterium 66-5]|nr:MAG: hypothetical protein BGO13_00955 [Burkholderiales bacterium 66-5]